MATMSATQENTIPPLTLGWRLQMAMKHADLNALDMAREMEVGRDTVARWLHDETIPHRLFLQAWADRCGVSYEWLTDDSDPKVARGTREPAGRKPVTDNKDSQERRRRPARKRADNHSYRHSRRRAFCLNRQSAFSLAKVKIRLDGREGCLIDHSAWVASELRRLKG